MIVSSFLKNKPLSKDILLLEVNHLSQTTLINIKQINSQFENFIYISMANIKALCGYYL